MVLSGNANKAGILAGVCYRPPNQDKELDEIFCYIIILELELEHSLGEVS